ncbi:MAG: ketoacyl-ACP synthase III [Sediminibacterium sp.]|nr:ketoacyl-ACP synthase III [Sediminibacterium sp.]
MRKINAVINGVGGYVPENKLTNADLEKMIDTNDDWITSRTGIKERGILNDPAKASSYMGAMAVKNLMEKTGLLPTDIECIICATVTPDMHFPSTANLIAFETGATNAFGFDVNAACCGFLFSLTTGACLIESGRYKKVVVVGTDKMSSIVDYTDRTTCILFGDGAGAVLLERTEEQVGVLDSILKSDGFGANFLKMVAGGSLKPPSIETITNKEHFIFQEGQTVFKFAVKGMADVSAELMEKNNLLGSDIAWLVPHQANLRIIDATAKRMGISKDKVMINIQNYGNTTDATIPLCLWNWESKLKKGDNLVLAAFGGGFTWGATWIKWGY